MDVPVAKSSTVALFPVMFTTEEAPNEIDFVFALVVRKAATVSVLLLLVVFSVPRLSVKVPVVVKLSTKL